MVPLMGHRILVVDDNPLNLKLMRDILVFQGYDVVEARTGEDGVALARSSDPDLVLMDLQLPGIDGYEALRRLRADLGILDLPVVAVTAFAMEEDRQRALAAGFDAYLAKPISIRALPSQLEAILAAGRHVD